MGRQNGNGRKRQAGWRLVIAASSDNGQAVMHYNSKILLTCSAAKLDIFHFISVSLVIFS